MLINYCWRKRRPPKQTASLVWACKPPGPENQIVFIKTSTRTCLIRIYVLKFKKQLQLIECIHVLLRMKKPSEFSSNTSSYTQGVTVLLSPEDSCHGFFYPFVLIRPNHLCFCKDKPFQPNDTSPKERSKQSGHIIMQKPQELHLSVYRCGLAC